MYHQKGGRPRGPRTPSRSNPGRVVSGARSCAGNRSPGAGCRHECVCWVPAPILARSPAGRRRRRARGYMRTDRATLMPHP